MKKTKIICTIGPASRNEKVLEEMLKSGMNVARLNFSHGTHEYHKETIEMFRRVRDRMKMPAAIMLDTKGPEIRLRDFAGGEAMLESGQTFVLTTEEVDGSSERASITYRDLPGQLKAGDRILIDDGRIPMIVKETTETEIVCEVISGGKISNHKGLNIPNVHLDMPYLNAQDEADIRFGIEQDVDFIAASFVRCKEDVITLRKFLDYYGGHSIKIISKIENIEGINNFDEILRYSDGIMVARGDMGVEIAFERLPGIQKKFIRRCYSAGKMVITATQMMESMITAHTPTRAEITDVANAVFDGSSAVMLSGETAVGAHPALVVKTMATIAEQAEADAFELDSYRGIKYENDTDDTTNAICDAACTTARDVGAKAIIAVTMHGYTARRVSKFRPKEPIVAATPVEKTFHQLSLSWGVYPVLARFQREVDVQLQHSIDCAKQIDAVVDGDTVVITAGNEGFTNLLKVETVRSMK